MRCPWPLAPLIVSTPHCSRRPLAPLIGVLPTRGYLVRCPGPTIVPPRPHLSLAALICIPPPHCRFGWHPLIRPDPLAAPGCRLSSGLPLRRLLIGLAPARLGVAPHRSALA